MKSVRPWSDRRRPRTVISEEEFKPLLASQAHGLLELSNGLLESTPEQWNQRQLYHLYQSSAELETYLDDFAAQENRQFFPIRHLVAVSKSLAVAMSGLIHLHSRFPAYRFADPGWAERTLIPCVGRVAVSIGERISLALNGLRERWTDLGMVWPDGALRVDSLAPPDPMLRLPRDLEDHRARRFSDGSGAEPSESPAAGIAQRFLDLYRNFERNRPRRLQGLDDLRRIRARYCTEVQCRRFEARIHNLESAYDSSVAAGPEEERFPDLLELRSSIGVALHLFEAATALAHLFERHLVDDRPRIRGQAVLREEELLQLIINDCVVTAFESMTHAVPVAAEVQEALSERLSAELVLPEGASLHARPVSLIVAVVSHHHSPVEAQIEEDRCSAASIMQLLVLVGRHPTARSMMFHGKRPVLEDLKALFEAGLGEDGLEGLPERLSYLRP